MTKRKEMNFTTKHFVFKGSGLGIDKSKRGEFYEYLWSNKKWVQ